MCNQAGLSKGVILPGKSKVNSKELNSLTVNLLKISRTVEYLGIYPLLPYPKDYCSDVDGVRTIKTEALQIHRSSVSSLGSIPS